MLEAPPSPTSRPGDYKQGLEPGALTQSHSESGPEVKWATKASPWAALKGKKKGELTEGEDERKK